MTAGGWTVTVAQLGVLWQAVGLGEPPVIWSHGMRSSAPPDPRDALASATSRLRRARLLDEADVPDPAVAAALRRIERAPLLVDLRCSTIDADELRALVVVDGPAAVRAVHTGGSVLIDYGPATRPVEELLAALPDVAPAPGRPVSLPADLIDRGVAAASDRGSGLDGAVFDELVLLGATKRDVRALFALVCGRRTGYAQIGVTRRRRGLDAVRHGEIVQLVDTGAGRAALWQRDGRLHAAPGTSELITSLVRDLVSRSGG